MKNKVFFNPFIQFWIIGISSICFQTELLHNCKVLKISEGFLYIIIGFLTISVIASFELLLQSCDLALHSTNLVSILPKRINQICRSFLTTLSYIFLGLLPSYVTSTIRDWIFCATVFIHMHYVTYLCSLFSCSLSIKFFSQITFCHIYTMTLQKKYCY